MLIVNFPKPDSRPAVSQYLAKLVSAFVASFFNTPAIRGLYIDACSADPITVQQVNASIAAIAGNAIGNIALASDAANLVYIRQLYTGLLAGLVASGADRISMPAGGFRLPINYIQEVSPSEMKITFWS